MKNLDQEPVSSANKKDIEQKTVPMKMPKMKRNRGKDDKTTRIKKSLSYSLLRLPPRLVYIDSGDRRELESYL